MKTLLRICQDFILILISFTIIELPASYFMSHNIFFRLNILTNPIFIFNLALLFSLFRLINIFFQNRYKAYFFYFTLLGLFSIANFLKLSFLNLPIIPSDIFLLSHFSLLVRYLNSPLMLIIILGALVILLLVLHRFYEIFFKKIFWRSPNLFSFILNIFSFSFLLLLYFSHFKLTQSLLTKADFKKLAWDLSGEAMYNGTPMTQILHAHQSKLLIPNNYNQKAIDQILHYDSNTTHALSSTPSDSSPNIVLILLESAWDPSSFAKNFSIDPLFNLKSFNDTGIVGSFISPTFGGHTSEVEFEVLTGLANRFFPEGAIPYQDFIVRRTESIAQEFKRQGYKTFAVHNWKRNFWKRSQNYPLMGIDTFFDIESLNQTIPKIGFPKDGPLFDKILNILNSETKPVFCFGITMSTHGDYNFTLPLSEQVTMSGLQVSEPFVKRVQTYTSLLHLSDEQLGVFKKKLKETSRETILIVFGDHLPSFGMNYQPYIDAGLISSLNPKLWTTNQALLMAQTPLAIWSNKKSLKNNFQGTLPLQIGANFLGGLILKLAGIKAKDPLIDYLENLNQNFPIIHPHFLIQRNPSANQLMIEDYSKLTFDRISGENYSEPSFLKDIK